MSCSQVARLLFIGIWNFCDDNGVHPYKPVSLKALIFPGDPIDSDSIRRLLDELSENGLIVLFEHSGKEYLQVTGWSHQRIDKPTIKYPDLKTGNPLKTNTSSGKFEEQSESTPIALLEASATEGKGIGISKDQKLLSKPSVMDGFDEFWKSYPRKEAKAQAKKAWLKIKPEPGLSEQIEKVLEYRKGTHDWTKEGGKFVPLPASWLNARRWEDEIQEHAAISVKAMNKILSIYNEVCEGAFQPASGVTDQRASELAALWHTQLDGKEVFKSPGGWEEYFNRCLKTNFSWVAKDEINFDFLIRKGNVAKVWECSQ